MQEVTITNDDGSTQDFFLLSHTDQAVQTALAQQAPANTVTPDVSEVDPVLTDGSTKKFVAAA